MLRAALRVHQTVLAFRQFVEQASFAKGISADKFDDLAASNRGRRGKTARKIRSLSELHERTRSE
jgi:hypothetical protein